MDWKGRRTSSNVEDRRGISGKQVAVGGGLTALIVLLLSWFTGTDLTPFLQFFEGGGAPTTQYEGGVPDYENDETAEMVSVVLASTEDVWTELFKQSGNKYQAPNLVLFSGHVESACGSASSAVGPFYCPGDYKVYIDLDFCNELATRFKAPGEFAVAYVIGHEVGHHIQNLYGLSREVQSQRGRISEAEYNALSVKLELQADFLAGVWAYYARTKYKMLEPGDLESALVAANSLGDDKLQMEARGYVVPESFTHGTSAQRMKWFKLGYDTGDISLGASLDQIN